MPRVALVTGSSRGLGAHIAHRLAADGMAVAVAVNGLDRIETEGVAEQIREQGLVAQAFVADITDQTALATLASQVRQRLGPVDVLVPNATDPQPEDPIEDGAFGEPSSAAGLLPSQPRAVGGGPATSHARPRLGTNRVHRQRSGRPAAA